jgi:hypothetical protein
MRLDAHSLVPRPCVYRSRLLCVAAQALLRTAYFEDGMACHAAAAATSGFGASLARCAVTSIGASVRPTGRVATTIRVKALRELAAGCRTAAGMVADGLLCCAYMVVPTALSMVNIGAWHGWHAGEARNGTATCTACAATRSTSLRRAS